MTDKGFLAICSEAKGIQGLAHDLDEMQVKITPVPPGHVSTYSLDQNGKASLIRDREFHYPGKEPQYTTEITSYSESAAQSINISVSSSLMFGHLATD